MSFLDASEMTGGYGAADILHGCTLKVEKGQIAVIVGPNGAGKSTAMKAVFGMLRLRGGRVTLQVAPETAGFLPLRIIDTGVGIGAEHRDSVFKAFHRLGHENSTISGAGIGLAIAKRFADVSGCQLDFDSVAGAGCTFTLRLPCRPE